MPWHLCSGSCSGSLPTRCWKHPADWLKEHRTFDCEKLFLRGLQTNTATRRAHVSSEERTTGIAWCASAVFLRVSRSPFTLTLKPRRSYTSRLGYFTDFSKKVPGWYVWSSFVGPFASILACTPRTVCACSLAPPAQHTVTGKATSKC